MIAEEILIVQSNPALRSHEVKNGLFPTLLIIRRPLMLLRSAKHVLCVRIPSALSRYIPVPPSSPFMIEKEILIVQSNPAQPLSEEWPFRTLLIIGH
jgi:hypothetical protein